MKTHWIRTTLASFVLAILLQIGFSVPFLTTFVVLGILFLTHIVVEGLGTGVKTTLSGLQFAGRMALGIFIFLMLRFIASEILGLFYPIDAFKAIDRAGGLWDGVLPGRNMGAVILIELLLACVAGRLSVAWVKNQGKSRKLVGTIFMISLTILGIQTVWPRTAEAVTPRPAAPMSKTATTKEKIDQAVAEDGVIPVAFKTTWRFLFGQPTKSVGCPSQPRQERLPMVTTPSPQTSGNGVATKSGLECWLDPPRMHVRPTRSVNGASVPRPARYVLASNPSRYFDDVGPGRNNNHATWASMPAGFYRVYPLEDDAIDFQWWQ